MVRVTGYWSKRGQITGVHPVAANSLYETGGLSYFVAIVAGVGTLVFEPAADQAFEGSCGSKAGFFVEVPELRAPESL